MRSVRWGLAAAALWRLFGPVLPLPWGRAQKHPWRVPARTIFAGDRELSVREVGPVDGPPVVLIHGLAGSSMAEWYKVAPLLADRFRLLMIDNRSHGLSVPEKERFEIEDLADDIATILDQLETGPVAAVGYSMGGAIAQALTYRHPQLVSRLVLVATLSHHPRGWREARQLGTLLTRGWERATGTGTPEVRTGYLLATGAVAPEHGRWLWEETHRRDPDAGAEASRALLRFDSRPWLGQIGVPTLVVIPTRDQLIPARWQREMARLIKGAETFEVIGGHHEMPWSHAELLAQRIEKFLIAETG
ncbi:MAG: alpha/beta fold hydrolase [Acidimicrobiia bacterium]